jgi:hypothetical protein
MHLLLDYHVRPKGAWKTVNESMTLTASAMGYSVYVRLGFVPVCTYRNYAPPPYPHA